MTWTPKEKEVEAMLSAPGRQRYEYFIHRVADNRKMWGLYSSTWAMLGEGDKKLIPLWPHEAYVERFREEDWALYEPKDIELGVFLECWIPDMKKAGAEPAIFPIASGISVVVSLDDLEADLRRELSDYYEEEGQTVARII